jgi:hypothetical protein
MVSMPTPVGPLGPDEIDPNDPDLWDWSGDYDDDSRPRTAPWIRVTAWVIAVVLAIALIASLLR